MLFALGKKETNKKGGTFPEVPSRGLRESTARESKKLLRVPVCGLVRSHGRRDKNRGV